MDSQRSGKFLQYSDTGSAGFPDPIDEKASRLVLAVLNMQLSKLFFQGTRQ
jgi:hypothetical protein